MKNLKLKSSPCASRQKTVAAVVLATVFFWACLPARPFRPVERISAGIVDMHCHIAGIGAGGSGCWVSPRMLNNWRFDIYLRSFGVTRKEVLEKGDDVIGK